MSSPRPTPEILSTCILIRAARLRGSPTASHPQASLTEPIPRVWLCGVMYVGSFHVFIPGAGFMARRINPGTQHRAFSLVDASMHGGDDRNVWHRRAPRVFLLHNLQRPCVAISSPRCAAQGNVRGRAVRTDGRTAGVKAIELQSAAVAKVVSKIAALCYAMRCEAWG